MTDEIFELILRIGTYDGETRYSSYGEMREDYKKIGSIALTPEDIRQLVFTAYEIGRARLGESGLPDYEAQ